MAGSVAKILVGANTQIKLGVYGTAVGSCDDMGYTKGGISIKDVIDHHFTEVDQEQGDIAASVVKRGRTLTIPMAEDDVARMYFKLGLPSTAVSSQTLSIGTAAVQYITIFLTSPAPSGGTRVTWIPKAVVVSSDRSYVKDNETIVNVELHQIFDTAQSDGEEFGTVVDSGTDVTPPTIEMSSPASGGTTPKNAKGVIQWLITETDNPIDEDSITYGDSDDSTFQIIDTTTPGSEVLVAGTISYNAATLTVTFTPTSNWTTLHTNLVIVNTNLRDLAGNHLAAVKIENFSVGS